MCPSIKLYWGHIISTLLITSDMNLHHMGRVVLFSPLWSYYFHVSQSPSHPRCKGRGIQPYLWSYVKNTRVSKFGKGYFWGCTNILLILKVSSLILLFINGSCLLRLLLGCFHGDFLFPSILLYLLIRILLKEIVVPLTSLIF